MPSVAPNEEQKPAYLPPLDQCFPGATKIISWGVAADTLANLAKPYTCPTLQAFLEDEPSFQALAAATRSSRPPNGQAKADFDTRTAAINVAQRDGDRYDIGQIKDDALWLAKHAKIDELTALRTTVLDWQERPRRRVLGVYTEEEDISLQRSVRQTIGNGLGASVVHGSVNTSNGSAHNERGQRNRRAQLMKTWYEEHRNTLAVRSLLARIPPGKEKSDSMDTDAVVGAKTAEPWVSTLNHKLCMTADSKQEYPDPQVIVLLQVLDAMRARISTLDSPPNALSEELDRDWFPELVQHIAQEVIDLLRLALMLIATKEQPVTPAITSNWYQSLAALGFLQRVPAFQLLDEFTTDRLQNLVSLVLFSLLDLENTPNTLDVDLEGEAPVTYALDPACVETISTSLASAVDSGASCAALVLVAWSTIGISLQANGSDPSFDGIDRRDSHPLSPALTRSTPTTRKFGQAWKAYVGDLRSGEATIEHFVRASIQGLDLYTQCGNIASTAQSILGERLFDSFTCSVVRVAAFDCLHDVSKIATYDAELVSAIITVIQGCSAEARFEGDSLPGIRQQLVAKFVATPSLLQLFEEALARYPYEIRPLLLLSQVLLSSPTPDSQVTERLYKAGTFTTRLPASFSSYESTQEQEYDNCFVLRDDLALFPGLASKQAPFANGMRLIAPPTSNAEVGSDQFIPQGTEGLALSKEHQPIISWNYEHSIITYLGQWLYEAHSNLLWESLPAAEVNVISSDILDLLTDLVCVARRHESTEDVQSVLINASEALPNHMDIVTVVADIFEDALSTSLREDDTELVLLMASSLAFLSKVVPSLPGRVWPLLSRSSLLDDADGDGRLLAVVASSERVTSAPALLHSVLDLFQALIDDILVNAVARHEPKKSSRSRFENDISVDPGISTKQMAKSMNALTRLTLGLLRHASDWRFESAKQQADVVSKAIPIVRRLTWYSHGLGDSDARPMVLEPLQPAGSIVTAFFLDSSYSHSNLSRLLAYMSPLASQDLLRMDPGTLTSFKTLASSSADLCTLLIHIGVTQNTISQQSAEHLAETVPILVRVYAGHSDLQADVALLLAQLAELIGSRQSISLFASLGADVAQDAALVLSDLADVVDDPTLARTRWELFSACIRNKQTWFASYLLTGSAPSRASRAVQGEASNKNTHTSLLEVALATLSSLTAISSPAAVAMLQVVTDALNHGPWSVNRICSHPKFLGRIAEHLDNLQWEPNSRDPETTSALADHTVGASLICEIFAMAFHGMRLVGNQTFVKEWAPRIPLLDQPGFKDPYYNRGLHQRFKQNFENRFKGLRVDDFRKRLDVATKEDKSYYDVHIIDELLRPSQQLVGSGSVTSSFVGEFQYADRNLCLVAAQKKLITRWQLLCLELVKDANDENKLPKKLAYVAHECLEANKASEEKDEVFSDLRTLRVELAITIMQKLIELRYTAGGMHSLLNIAWDVTRAARPDFENAFVGEDTEYYRLCVKLILLCLRPYTIANMLLPPSESGGASQSQSAPLQKVQMLLEIAVEVVAKGFRSLASHLHEQSDSVVPGDFVLLTSLLQVLLQVRGAENTSLYSQLAIRLSNFDLGRYATALFSWSDRIMDQNDPIYGEISITLLAEMSVLPSLAEALATDGVLSQLNTANLMTYYQRPSGTGPFEEPLRMHKIWTRGILPLVLNVLIAVGAPFAAEAATFINNFAPQLELASNALDSKAAPTQRDPYAGCVTYNAACEAHTLSLVAAMLDRFRETDDADVPELLWDRAAVKEDVETWVHGTRRYLRERLVPTNEKEVLLTRTKPLGAGSEVQSRLEELVLKELKGALYVLGGG